MGASGLMVPVLNILKGMAPAAPIVIAGLTTEINERSLCDRRPLSQLFLPHANAAGLPFRAKS